MAEEVTLLYKALQSDEEQTAPNMSLGAQKKHLFLNRTCKRKTPAGDARGRDLRDTSKKGHNVCVLSD